MVFVVVFQLQFAKPGATLTSMASFVTLKVKILTNGEQHCLLSSLVDDFTCVHSKNALLTHILSTLFSSTSVLFSCTPFGTKSKVRVNTILFAPPHVTHTVNTRTNQTDTWLYLTYALNLATCIGSVPITYKSKLHPCTLQHKSSKLIMHAYTLQHRSLINKGRATHFSARRLKG